MNSVVLNNCYRYRNVFKNGADALLKWLKKPMVFVKSSNFHVVRTIKFCSNFTSIWYKHFVRNVWRDIRLPLATGAGKKLTAYLLQKLIFRSGILCYHCWCVCWCWRSKFSIHYLKVFGPHAGQIWTKPYDLNCTKFWAFWQKGVSHFGRGFCDWNNCFMLNY